MRHVCAIPFRKWALKAVHKPDQRHTWGFRVAIACSKRSIARVSEFNYALHRFTLTQCGCLERCGTHGHSGFAGIRGMVDAIGSVRMDLI